MKKEELTKELHKWFHEQVKSSTGYVSKKIDLEGYVQIDGYFNLTELAEFIIKLSTN